MKPLFTYYSNTIAYDFFKAHTSSIRTNAELL